MTGATTAAGLRWGLRDRPLAVGGCVGRGPVARALVDTLLARDDHALARLEGVGGPGFVAVFGQAEALPWVDGILYVGREPDAAGLWSPTTSRADAPPDLVLRAALRRVGGAGPVLVLPDLVALLGGLPLDRRHLEAWRRAAG